MQRHPQGRGVVLTAVLVLGFLTLAYTSGALTPLYENVSFFLDPTPERAYEYGNRHFDAGDAAYYDLARAESFYNQTLAMNPEWPLIQHQLARIEFLRGNFPVALARINTELEINPEPSPSSYYVRGLIKGFMGDYDGAALDYEIYLRTNSKNWAGINDYAWVLLKANRPKDALVALDWGLVYFPENPWLLNNRATALFELGRNSAALETAQKALAEVTKVSEAQWLQAYPGNDPLIAPQGIAAFRKAVEDNIHTISLALEKEPKDVQ